MPSSGASLLCLGRDENRLGQTVAQLSGTGHSYHTADIDNADALTQLVEKLAAETGPFSGVVHSAGVQRATPLRIAKSEDFLAQYRTNALKRAALLTAVAKRNVASPQGCSVVIVGSVMSVLGAAGLAAYCSSKSALTGLVQAAGLELARRCGSMPSCPAWSRRKCRRNTWPRWPMTRCKRSAQASAGSRATGRCGDGHRFSAQ